jgi:hypothetical protein
VTEWVQSQRALGIVKGIFLVRTVVLLIPGLRTTWSPGILSGTP